MKKLTLLCLACDQAEVLEALRDLGVVHVTDRRPPAGEDLDALREHQTSTERAFAALPKEAADIGAAEAPAAAEVVADVLALLDRRDALERRADELRKELARYAAFGAFDLDVVREIERAGVWTALAVAPSGERLTAPEGVMLTELRRDRAGLHAVLAGTGPRPDPFPSLGGHHQVLPWPARQLDEAREELSACEAELATTAEQLERMAPARAAVGALAQEVAEETRFQEVLSGMEEAGEVALLSGYLPAPEQDAVREAAAAHGWGLLLDDPVEGEDVPVLLKQSRLVAPVRTVFDFLHIYPGYWEADVGWIFLPFFSIFFAMIVGDAGYAALLLIATVLLQRRLRKVPAHVFHMMYIVGAATLVWGVLNGSYFGIPTLPPFLEALEVPWIQDRDNVIDLCFFIGAVHLSFAHVWNSVSCVRARTWSKLLAQAGWLVVVWSMFFLARQTVLGRAVPSFLLWALLIGILLIALFMKTPREFRESWIDHALLPLTMVGSFVDILSYIRLFAVGYASVAVLAAFNEMAASIGFDSVLTAVAASLLLLFANALNIVLAGLGVLVHAVRLNTLEFSTHKGLAWAGYRLYSPFGKRGETA